jgi:hypothetical protein
MKIYHIAQFEDEGRDIEEKIEEREAFEAQKELDDVSIGKRGETHTAEVLNEAGKILGKSIQSSWVASGAVGWFKYKDGIIYEVLVSPAAQGQYFNHFKNLMMPEQPETKEDVI